ncbi:cupin domain-containing protein [Colletotrichum truncatum]|uniref:Cupin domain-containing protein n=1 Tax=Colletotrichum truncatum TaxID=5467 RepID=A0ACC3ZAA7_COLTU|nr:cupin domain-containing protein [Colletotrichum truncatum]KAF6796190.1 cupin domain-containing protein [Colletotrichum truncatum]
MPPRPTNVRRRETSTGDFHELGVKGRKTGIELPDTGVRDEHGMQPIDGLFSSPEKDGGSPGDDATRGEQDMELDSDTGAGPATILKGHPRLIPRGTSPRKTNLSSPAVRHPNFGVSSSPTRGSPYRGSPPQSHSQPVRGESVSRRLDYGASERHGAGLNGKRANGINGRARSTEDDEDEPVANGSPVDDGGEESMQMVGMDGGDQPEPESEVEAPDVEQNNVEESEEEAPKQAVKRKGRPPKAKAPVIEEAERESSDAPEPEDEPAPPKKRGRPAKGKGKATADDVELEPEVNAPKRRRSRNSKGNEDEHGREEAEDRASKRQRTEVETAKPGKRGRPKATAPVEAAEASTKQAAKPAAKPAARGRPGRKPQAAVGDDSIVGLVQKGPPMPKARGLVSQKKQQDPHTITKTRSGRQSYRPLAYWKNEHVTYDDDEAFEAGKKDRFLLPSIKEVVRVEEEQEARKRRTRGRKPGKGKRRQDDSEDEEEPEPWEMDPGNIEGEIVVWQPEHEFNPPAINEQVEIDEDRIAVSASAIQTRDIRDATFRFAKTLSLPFFGSGVVDLPPGAEKRPKNSRKMQMVFFVFQGKVLVTVHETQFRIGAGGMWFVPRGNYYSIHNDYENPARIFFAQGCEVSNMMAGTPGPSQDTTIMG